MVATPVFYPHLSGAENLRVLAAAWGWPEARTAARITAALDLVDLGSVGGRAAKGYSTGMRQRLGIALALLADPPILILDEPVNGLDPAGIVEIRDLLIALAGGGRTILVSSHLLTEVEKTCDHVTIVDRGRIVAAGTPDSLAGGGERIELRLAAEEIPTARRALEAAGFRVSQPPDPGELWVEGAPDGSTVARLLAAVGCYPDELIRRRDSLEDVFLRLTGPQSDVRRDAPACGRPRPLRSPTRPVDPGRARAGHPRRHVPLGIQQRDDTAAGRLLHRSARSRCRGADAGPDARGFHFSSSPRTCRPSRSRRASSRSPATSGR